MDLSQFSTEALQAMKKKKQLLTDVVGGAIDKAKEAIVQQPEITNKSREAWLAGLNPNDYQTALNADEVQRFSDWAKATNAPISQGYDMQGYWKDNIAPFDALKGKYTDEQIAGARQGLNNGNVDLAKFIEQNNIRRPGTPSEIALAKQGKFNPVGEFTHAYDTPWSDTYSTDSKYATGDNAKYAGTFKDGNYTSAVDQATKDGILQQVMSGFENYGDTDKTGWNKVGKGLDIARAVASNPLLQGAVAGAISAKTTGDVGKGIQTGVNWAQDKAKSNFYARQLGQKPGVFGTYTKDDYNARTLDNYRKATLENNQRKVDAQMAIAQEKDKLKKIDLVYKFLRDGTIKDTTSLLPILAENGLTLQDLQQSNQTRNINSQIERRTHQNKTDDEKVAIDRQKANNQIAIAKMKASSKSNANNDKMPSGYSQRVSAFKSRISGSGYSESDKRKITDTIDRFTSNGQYQEALDYITQVNNAGSSSKQPQQPQQQKNLTPKGRPALL